MMENTIYVYILRREGTATMLGVFAEESAALASESNFLMIHGKMFPHLEKPTCSVERHEVIGGFAAVRKARRKVKGGSDD